MVGFGLAFQAVFADIAHNPHDGEQAQVPIHVAKLDRPAQWVLIGPLLARQRLANQCHVRRIHCVALIEEPATQQGNA